MCCRPPRVLQAVAKILSHTSALAAPDDPNEQPPNKRANSDKVVRLSAVVLSKFGCSMNLDQIIRRWVIVIEKELKPKEPPKDKDGRPLPPPNGKKPPEPPKDKDGRPLPPPNGKKPPEPPKGKDGKPLAPPTGKAK